MTTKLTERVEIVELFAYEITGERRPLARQDPTVVLTATLLSIALTLKNLYDLVETIDQRTHDDL